MNVEAGGARRFAPRPLFDPTKTMKKYVSILLALCVVTVARAARIDTVAVHSASMQCEIPALVIVPEAAAEHPLPVLYLLHGYSGSHTAWQGITDLRPLSETYSMIIVCPDGENSWYWDSPKNPDVRFETFVAAELPAWVDARYPTVARREGRAVAGLSMGGHGALWLSIRHRDVFGAAGSMSGGVDIRPFPDGWQMKELLGELSENPEVWDAHTVMTQVDSLRDGDLAIIFDCGYDDFFFGVNTALHEKLRALGIQHDFVIRPGGHNNAYWANSLPYQMLFFQRFFSTAGAFLSEVPQHVPQGHPDSRRPFRRSRTHAGSPVFYPSTYYSHACFRY